MNTARGGVSNSSRYPATAGLATALPRRSASKERRRLCSRFQRLTTTRVGNAADIRSFFDQCARSGFDEQHGHPQRLLEYRLGLVRQHAQLRRDDVVLDVGCGTGHHLLALGREIAYGVGVDLSPGMIEVARARLRASPWQSRLTFEVDDAEELREVATQSVDLAICIGAFEHMLDKQAVLASVYRVLKCGGRFLCLSADADYVWYRRIAPLIGFATTHLSTDSFLIRDEFVGLLDRAGFCPVQSVPWTFIPKGDMPTFAGLLLGGLAAIGECARLASLRGGLCVCAWKGKSDRRDA
jgi:SAM-dependent methyltransferase